MLFQIFGGTRSVVRPASLALTGNLLEMQAVDFTQEGVDQKLWQWGWLKSPQVILISDRVMVCTDPKEIKIVYSLHNPIFKKFTS